MGGIGVLSGVGFVRGFILFFFIGKEVYVGVRERC